MDQRAFQLAKEVYEFLMERSGQPDSYNGPMCPFDDFAYGSALAHWERNEKPNRAWFSTKDPYMLHYASSLTIKFGLPIVTRDEGNRRAKVQATKTKVVTEASWLEDLGIVDPFGKEIGEPDD